MNRISQKQAIRILGISFMIFGLTFAIAFSIPAKIDPNPAVWLTPEYYSQFLPVAVSAMLLICGIFLAFAQSKANFNLAIFGHTASEEALFHWIGLTKSALPTWIIWFFFIISLVTLWIAYSNVLKQKRLSVGEALFGIGFGAFIVLLPSFF